MSNQATVTSGSGASQADAVLLVERPLPGLVRLTLNRPAAFHALDLVLLQALEAQLRALQQDETLKLVVLAASGRAFCAGLDLAELQALQAQGGEDEPGVQAALVQRFDLLNRVTLLLRELPAPVLAQVQGVATAAGCQLVAACDLAYAADTARFAVSGINLGLFCATPAVALSRNIGRKAAMHMLLTGEFIAAVEAKRLGLINDHAAPEQLDALVQSCVQSILAKPVQALHLGKALFHRQIETGVQAAYQMASHTMACNLMTAPTRAGIDAFLHKRPVRFD